VSRLLITGADGFVGRWLVRAARARGHEVIASITPDRAIPDEWSHDIEVVRADLRSPRDYAAFKATRADGVIHLAAIASGTEARRDPALANAVNAQGSAMLARSFSATAPPRFLQVSSGEVYGAAHGEAINEAARPAPVSAYARSKLDAEAAVGEVAHYGAIELIVVRSFPHSGPGQTDTYVLPALARRLRLAQRQRATTVATGNLAPIRDFLDVRDVVDAYLALFDRGTPGEVYNVASGVGRSIAQCFAELARIMEIDAVAMPSAEYLRPDDIPVLIGDAGKLRHATGWSPRISFDRMLQDLVDAQTD
jgi:GDP-4-dehydro-6-deoxy-D-mannose reductase